MKVLRRGLDWGWIVVLLQVFSFRELLFYCAVAKLQCRDRVSLQHDGDSAWVAREAEALGGRARIGHKGAWVGRERLVLGCWGESRSLPRREGALRGQGRAGVFAGVGAGC